MVYSPELMEHYNNPRNIGSLDSTDPHVGTSMVGAPACGDVMRLQVMIKDGVIQNAVFKTFGCGSAIASSSYATELLKGKTIKEAKKLRNSDIAKYLSLPPVKIHCSLLAEDAITAAIQDWQKKNNVSDEELEAMENTSNEKSNESSSVQINFQQTSAA